ncbi:MAG: alpha/beta fold hydrolase [Rhodospirillaceae bacterium]|nr:alpha/beta fold hydrolase [Rhodospirillaceae bacterium]
MSQSTVATRFGTIACVSEGKGAPLLLLPGTGQNHAIFTRQIAALAPHFRVVAVDTPGSPGSAPLPNPLTIERLAESVAATMDALGIAKAHVYGIHLGNKVGAALCANWPDRVGDFVFSGQSHSIMADNDARNDFIRGITRHHFEGPADDPAKGDSRRLYDANFAYDLAGDLRRIPNRTLIVEIATPEEDTHPGRQGAALLRYIPRSTLVTFEEPDGLGHTLDNRAEELAAEILRFVEA